MSCHACLAKVFPSGSARNAWHRSQRPTRVMPTSLAMMKFYLTLLRRNGRRLAEGQLADRDRLVSARLTIVQGIQHLEATCCFGGSKVGELWDPVLTRLGNQEMIFRGIERLADAGVVQEWRLRPHMGWQRDPPAPSQFRPD